PAGALTRRGAEDGRPTGEIDELQVRVRAGAEEKAAICGEGERGDRPRPAVERPHGLAEEIDVPQMNASVAAARGEEPPLGRRAGERVEGAGVGDEVLSRRTVFRAPGPKTTVGTARHESPVARDDERQRRTEVAVAVPERPATALFVPLPDLEAPVPAGGGEEAPAEDDGADRPPTMQGRELRAVRGVPNAHVPVVAARG